MNDGDEVNHILLTGAGFSKNFGLPLAIEVWGQLFNDKRVKRNECINNAFKYNKNYEEIYDYVRRNAGYEMDELYELYNDLFKKMDATLVSYLLNPSRNVNLDALRNFFLRFSGKGNGIFTLNHDIFVERLFSNYTLSELETPKVPSLRKIYETNNVSDGLGEYKKPFNQFLPYEILIWEYLSKNGETDFVNKIKYFKLHGSCNWRAKNKNIFLIGRNKESLIKDYPILKEYFDFFNEMCKNSNTKVCCIGYGFNDRHINEVIANSNLKISVISPSSPDLFMEEMVKGDDYKKEIWRNKIEYYYQADLKVLFPTMGTSKIYDEFRRHFWSGDNPSDKGLE